MKLIHLIVILTNFLLISPQNLRNLVLDDELLLPRSENYKNLTQEANDTFYQLYDIQLDFKDRYYLEIDDDTKYLRVIINENDENMNSKNENLMFIKSNNGLILSDDGIPENVNITLFGRTYNLRDELWNILNSIFRYSDIDKISFPREDMDKFDTISKYELYDKNSIGSIDVIIEDKDDKVAIEEALDIFWDSVKNLIPEKNIFETKLAAEFVAITFGIRRAVINRREKLVIIANETFYELYNISLDFKGRNMIEVNQDDRYYKVLINEYPKYEGMIFTKINFKNSRVFFEDFPIFSSLTFDIFGRVFNLKEEFLSVIYLIAPIIKDGVIRIEKSNLDKFDSQINCKYELFRENEESQGAFEIIFEDKEDKRQIEKTLNSFWNTWSSQIPEHDQINAKLISQFVVTTFGIWHNIQNRYDKITNAAKLSLYQLLNRTIDFQGRYVYAETNGIYELAIIIDEFPLEPTANEIGTYFNISNGMPIFPQIANKSIADIKLNIAGSTFDVEEEYKMFGSIFASGIRNGRVNIYKKNTESVSNIIRFKCFVKSQNNEDYGAFEISLKFIEKTTWEKIKEGIKKFWDDCKAVLTEVNEGIKLASEIAGNINGIKDTIIKIIPKPSNSLSTYLNYKMPLMFLNGLLLLVDL